MRQQKIRKWTQNQKGDCRRQRESWNKEREERKKKNIIMKGEKKKGDQRQGVEKNIERDRSEDREYEENIHRQAG